VEALLFVNTRLAILVPFFVVTRGRERIGFTVGLLVLGNGNTSTTHRSSIRLLWLRILIFAFCVLLVGAIEIHGGIAFVVF